MSEIIRFWPVLTIAAIMLGLIVSFFSGMWIILVSVSAISALGFAAIVVTSITSIGSDFLYRQEVPATLISIDRGDGIQSRRDPSGTNSRTYTNYEVKVRYSYEVGGKHYESQKYGRTSTFVKFEDFEELERTLRSKNLKAHVLTEQPADAVLNLEWAAKLTSIIFGLLGAIAFSVPVWFWWRR